MKCFVIMPFAEPFDSVFRVVKDAAATAVPDMTFDCFWLKDIQAAGRITDDILKSLEEAAICIADVSGHNPNVMWETGYAMARGKPTILIGQDIRSLPFDLKSHRILEYSLSNIAQMGPKLAEAIRQTLARYELKGSGLADFPVARKAGLRTITVTGTMGANEAAVCHRLEHTLTPYLSAKTLWLLGTTGVVDLAGIRFLLERQQKVTAVGYTRFDCAPETRKWIENGQIDFIDASLEAIPKLIPGPNNRDKLFCMKSDLIVLFWDGKSQGTKKMVGFFQEQGIATHLAFI